MEKKITDRYSPAILQSAMRRFAIADGDINLLDGFESYIYEFRKDGGEFILRIAHSLRRSVGMISAEVDWINFLADGGASVARAVLSANGKLVELVDDGLGGHFLATAFDKIQGRIPMPKDLTPPVVENYGRLIGRMNALSQDYRPSKPKWKRFEWDDIEMLNVIDFIPPGDEKIGEYYEKVITQLRALPKTPDAYGLIHQDAHAANIFIDDAGDLTIFDFDDCAYSWFVNDIALVLFYAVMWQEDKAAFTNAFMRDFLRGYAQENKLDPRWLKEIPHFMKIREIDIYAVIHRSFDLNDLDWWCAGFMKGRRENLLANKPYLDYDFQSLAKYL